jgi:enoyl-CoA hydratase
MHQRSSGQQLGGGCELALMCDIILASPTAKFGQPEINLGVIPGGGGTQRLTRIVGKSRAMELMLTGRNFSAEEAEKWGMVSRVVGPGEGEVVKEAVEMAKVIASKGQLAVQAAKEAINAGQPSASICHIDDIESLLNQHSNCQCQKD